MKKYFIIILLLTVTLQPAKAENVEKFVKKLYAPYESNESPNYFNDPEKIFSKRLASLIKQDSPEGEVGRLDHDPICDSQDPEGLIVQNILINQSLNKYGALVTFNINKEQHQVYLDLIKENGKWKIDNISESSIPDMIKFLSSND
jgi:hypothetical protein